MSSHYEKYPNLAKMSPATLTKNLEATCLDALSCGWHPERIKGLIDHSIEHEEYELTQAILSATERFSQNPQLALFLFDVPDQVKEPLPVEPPVDPLAFLSDYDD